MSSVNAQRLFWLSLGVVLVLLLIPVPAIQVSSVSVMDKLIHTGLFAVLGCLACRGWPRAQFMACAWLFAFGLFTEVLQGLVFWRTASGWDAVANSIGVVLSFYVFRTTRTGNDAYPRIKLD